LTTAALKASSRWCSISRRRANRRLARWARCAWHVGSDGGKATGPAADALRTAQVLNALGVDPGLSWKGPWRWWSEEARFTRLPARAHADTLAAGAAEPLGQRDRCAAPRPAARHC
jgi:hypothetical protein